MTKEKNPYIAMFKMYSKQELSYKGKAFWGLVTQIFWGCMLIMIYSAFYETGNGPSDFTMNQMASYLWLHQAFFALSYMGQESAITNLIVKGDVAYEFIRPFDLYLNWYSRVLAKKIVGTLLRFAPIILLSALLPAGIGLSAPAGIWAFLLFVVSLLLGAMLSSAIAMFINILTFKTMVPKGAAAIVSVIYGLLGGIYVPLPLLPQLVQNILNFLPFRYAVDLPFRIYVGNIDPLNGLFFVLIQIVWIGVLILIGKLLMKRCLKNVEVQGG